MKSKLQCTLISMAAVCIPAAVWAVVPMQSRSGGWDDAESTQRPISRTQAFPRANAEGLWFEGNLGYSKVWKENRRGFYRIEGKADAQPEEILVNQYYGNGGGCYVADENIYVSCSYLDVMGDVYDCLMTVYDGTTYEPLYQKEASQRAMAWDLTYNPVDRKVYGCFHDIDAESGYNLGTLDYATGKVTEICDVEMPYVALAADEMGNLYGIEAVTGNFCSINCDDGTKTVIKNLGLSPEYLQSATYDCAKKRIYWFSQTVDTSVLYEINPADGSMVKIADYTPALDEWMGMFTRTPMAADAAPSICTDVKLLFDGPACSGEWNFVLPSTTYPFIHRAGFSRRS